MLSKVPNSLITFVSTMFRATIRSNLENCHLPKGYLDLEKNSHLPEGDLVPDGDLEMEKN